MKKAVFLGGTNNHILEVYNESILDQLKSELDLDLTFIDRENIKEYAEMAKSAEYAFSTWGMPAFTEEEIKAYFPNLKIVFYAAGTVQGFARPFINSGIKVLSAWAANAVPVAEYAVAQILLANKGFFQNVGRMRKDYWKARDYTSSFPGNYNVKVGLLGAGMIGTKVIELLKPYKVDVLVFDPFLPDEKGKAMGVTKAGLTEVFASCQTVSNHLANLPATQGILNKACFEMMLPNGTFINTGRGAQVVNEDLIAALKQEPARTAVLDVTDPEEPLGEDSEFFKLDNVFITSHIAGSMSNEFARMAQYMLDEFLRFEKGEDLRYEVTLKMLETMA